MIIVHSPLVLDVGVTAVLVVLDEADLATIYLPLHSEFPLLILAGPSELSVPTAGDYYETKVRLSKWEWSLVPPIKLFQGFNLGPREDS